MVSMCRKDTVPLFIAEGRWWAGPLGLDDRGGNANLTLGGGGRVYAESYTREEMEVFILNCTRAEEEEEEEEEEEDPKSPIQGRNSSGRRSLFRSIHGQGGRTRRRSLLPAVTEEASTIRCRVAPAQTNPRRREGEGEIPNQMGPAHRATPDLIFQPTRLSPRPPDA